MKQVQRVLTIALAAIFVVVPAVMAQTSTDTKASTDVKSDTKTSVSGQASPAAPANRDECKDDGWKKFGFKNQGQCVRAVSSGKDRR